MKLYKCSHCNIFFERERYLNKHKRNHAPAQSKEPYVLLEHSELITFPTLTIRLRDCNPNPLKLKPSPRKRRNSDGDEDYKPTTKPYTTSYKKNLKIKLEPDQKPDMKTKTSKKKPPSINPYKKLKRGHRNPILVPPDQLGFTILHLTRAEAQAQNVNLRKYLVCTVCQQKCDSKPNLLKHFKVHTQETPYKCVKCHRTFRRIGDLNRHSREACKFRGSIKETSCIVCRKKFSCNRYVEDHMKATKCGKSGNLEKFREILKQQGYYNRPRLTLHRVLNVAGLNRRSVESIRRKKLSVSLKRKIEENNGTFCCQLCPSKFVTEEDLLVHNKTPHRIQLESENIECTLCKVKTTGCYTLGSHYWNQHKIVVDIFTISKNRTGRYFPREKCHLPCKLCQEKCTSKRELQKHMVQAHVGSQFKCTFCGQCFHKKLALNVHYTAKHKTKILDKSTSDGNSSDSSVYQPHGKRKKKFKARQALFHKNNSQQNETTKTEIIIPLAQIKSSDAKIDADSIENEIDLTFNCPYCDKTITGTQAWDIHIESHNPNNTMPAIVWEQNNNNNVHEMKPYVDDLVTTCDLMITGL